MNNALKIGTALFPTAVGVGMNLFGNKESEYERKMSKMARMFEDESLQPINNNRAFKSGMKVIDDKDRENRKDINNASAVSGSTNEAKLGMIDSANQARDQQVNRLLQNAARYRDIMQNKAMKSYAMVSQLNSQRNQLFGEKVNAITGPLGKTASALIGSDLFEGGEDNTSNKDQLKTDRNYWNPNAGFWGGS